MFVIDQSFIKNKRAAFFTENSPSKHDMVSTLRVDATLYYILLLHFYAISTRASARDATIGLAAPIVLIRVSTHASARDATLRRFTRGKAFVVSTHASARDATSCLLTATICKSFQLTRPRGTRHFHRRRGDRGYLFQLTRPRGTRHSRTPACG